MPLATLVTLASSARKILLMRLAMVAANERNKFVTAASSESASPEQSISLQVAVHHPSFLVTMIVNSLVILVGLVDG